MFAQICVLSDWSNWVRLSLTYKITSPLLVIPFENCRYYPLQASTKKASCILKYLLFKPFQFQRSLRIQFTRSETSKFIDNIDSNNAVPYSCSHFNMRNWHRNITNRNKIASGTPAWGDTLLYEMSSRLKPIVNWAISMKIASVRRRFLSEFVVKFIIQRLFGFRCETERLLRLRI